MREHGHARAAYAERVAHAIRLGRRGTALAAGSVYGGVPLLDAWRTVLLLGWDTVSALSALWLARTLFAVRLSAPSPQGIHWSAWLALPILAVTTQFYFDAYRFEVLRSRTRACFQSLKAAVVSGVLFLLGLSLLAPGAMAQQEMVATLGVLAICTLGIRIFLRDAVGLPIRRVLIVGSGAGTEELASVLREDRGYVFAGRVEEGAGADAAARTESTESRSLLPPLNPSLPAVVVTEDGTLSRSVSELLRSAGVSRVPVFAQARFYESLTGRVASRYLCQQTDRPLGELQLEPALIGMKRVVDTLLAALLLAIAAPAMMVVAALVKLTSAGPCFYSQVRVGMNGCMFRLWKFRSMQSDAESGTGPVWAARNDPRVTRLGRILRLARLDELPQLWNVLCGDMSLTGPRPERPVFVARFRETIPSYENRLAVRPGLTGWAQVMHHYDETEADVAVKLQYDLFYIKHWSPLLDLQIWIKTIATVLTGSGAR